MLEILTAIIRTEELLEIASTAHLASITLDLTVHTVELLPTAHSSILTDQ